MSLSEAAKSALDSGEWKAVHDDASGKTYYVERATKRTSWDLDKEVASCGSARRRASNSPPNVRQALASGEWREVKDKTSGKPYYVHRDSKKTTWDLEKELVDSATPSPDPPAPVRGNSPASGTGRKTPVKLPLKRPMKSPAVSPARVPKPPGIRFADDYADRSGPTLKSKALASGEWREKFDNTSGKKYYIHAASNRTTWDLEKELQGAQTTNPTSAADMVKKALHSGEWKEVEDKKTGRKYFVNAKTKATTWDLEKELGIDAAQSRAASGSARSSSVPLPSANGGDQSFLQASARAALQSGEWKIATDKKTGKQYYVHKETKRTTWDLDAEIARSSPPEEATSIASVSRHEQTIAKPAFDATQAAMDALHSGQWNAVDDAETGKTYYVEDSTKRVIWDLEAELQDAHDKRSKGDTMHISADFSSKETPAGAATASRPPLPPGWTEGTDPITLSVFYQHKSGRTSGTHPAAAHPVSADHVLVNNRERPASLQRRPRTHPVLQEAEAKGFNADEEVRKATDVSGVGQWHIVPDRRRSGVPYYVHSRDGRSTWDLGLLLAQQFLAKSNFGVPTDVSVTGTSSCWPPQYPPFSPNPTRVALSNTAAMHPKKLSFAAAGTTTDSADATEDASRVPEVKLGSDSDSDGGRRYGYDALAGVQSRRWRRERGADGRIYYINRRTGKATGDLQLHLDIQRVVNGGVVPLEPTPAPHPAALGADGHVDPTTAARHAVRHAREEEDRRQLAMLLPLTQRSVPPIIEDWVSVIVGFSMTINAGDQTACHMRKSAAAAAERLLRAAAFAEGRDPDRAVEEQAAAALAAKILAGEQQRRAESAERRAAVLEQEVAQLRVAVREGIVHTTTADAEASEAAFRRPFDADPRDRAARHAAIALPVQMAATDPTNVADALHDKSSGKTSGKVLPVRRPTALRLGESPIEGALSDWTKEVGFFGQSGRQTYSSSVPEHPLPEGGQTTPKKLGDLTSFVRALPSLAGGLSFPDGPRLQDTPTPLREPKRHGQETGHSTLLSDVVSRVNGRSFYLGK